MKKAMFATVVCLLLLATQPAQCVVLQRGWYVNITNAYCTAHFDPPTGFATIPMRPASFPFSMWPPVDPRSAYAITGQVNSSGLYDYSVMTAMRTVPPQYSVVIVTQGYLGRNDGWYGFDWETNYDSSSMALQVGVYQWNTFVPLWTQTLSGHQTGSVHDALWGGYPVAFRILAAPIPEPNSAVCLGLAFATALLCGFRRSRPSNLRGSKLGN